MVGETLAEHMREFPPLADGSLFYGHNERPYAHALFGTKMFKAAVRRLAEAEESTFPSGTTTLSRPEARFWCCHQPVSPGRSPNPPYRSLGNGLSTVSAVRRGSWLSARGRGSCCPGRCNG